MLISRANYHTDFTSCPIPEQPANGRIEMLDRRLGGLVNYKCEEGFQMMGIASRSCLSSGGWSGTFPKCLASGASATSTSTFLLITPNLQKTTPLVSIEETTNSTSILPITGQNDDNDAAASESIFDVVLANATVRKIV